MNVDGLAEVTEVPLVYDSGMPADADATAALVEVAGVTGTAVTVTTLVITVGMQVLTKMVDRTGPGEVETGATTTGTEVVLTTAVLLELA